MEKIPFLGLCITIISQLTSEPLTADTSVKLPYTANPFLDRVDRHCSHYNDTVEADSRSTKTTKSMDHEIPLY